MTTKLFRLFKKNKNDIDLEAAESKNAPSKSTNELLKHTIDTIESLELLNKELENVYSFLQKDFEAKGYNDALVNQDESYKNENIKLLRLDLEIMIDKTMTYYGQQLTSLNFHAMIRNREGFADLLKELEYRKNLINDYQTKLLELKKSLNDNSGICQRIDLSYQKGFTRALHAITMTNILNRPI